jgi:hypothetical protein
VGILIEIQQIAQQRARVGIECFEDRASLSSKGRLPLAMPIGRRPQRRYGRHVRGRSERVQLRAPRSALATSGRNGMRSRAKAHAWYQDRGVSPATARCRSAIARGSCRRSLPFGCGCPPDSQWLAYSLASNPPISRSLLGLKSHRSLSFASCHLAASAKFRRKARSRYSHSISWRTRADARIRFRRGRVSGHPTRVLR